jgi:hypothetical protein
MSAKNSKAPSLLAKAKALPKANKRNGYIESLPQHLQKELKQIAAAYYSGEIKTSMQQISIMISEEIDCCKEVVRAWMNKQKPPGG